MVAGPAGAITGAVVGFGGRMISGELLGLNDAIVAAATAELDGFVADVQPRAYEACQGLAPPEQVYVAH